MFTDYRCRSLLMLLGLLGLAGMPLTGSASHSWGGYHWSTDSLPLNLDLGDNLGLTSPWTTGYYLENAARTPWTAGCAGDLNGPDTDYCKGAQPIGSAGTIASKVSLKIVQGGTRSDVLNCSPTAGRVEVCNTTYGKNGWLGVAQIWVSGLHITQGTAKLNDTYFNTAKYNTTEWRKLVLCQEVGHTFGLDHQNEVFGNKNLGTCMDYTSYPAGDPKKKDPPNLRPNYHDFEELVAIYHTHTSSASTTSSTTGKMPPGMSQDLSDRSQWGKLIRESNGGRTAVYERDFGGGHKVFTFVIRAE